MSGRRARSATHSWSSGHQNPNMAEARETSVEAKEDVPSTDDTLSTPAEWVMVCAGSGSSSSTPKLQCVLSGRTDCVCNKQPQDRPACCWKALLPLASFRDVVFVIPEL